MFKEKFKPNNDKEDLGKNGEEKPKEKQEVLGKEKDKCPNCKQELGFMGWCQNCRMKISI